MILFRDIRYVRRGTRDLDACAAFAREILGLDFPGRPVRVLNVCSTARAQGAGAGLPEIQAPGLIHCERRL